MKIYLKNVGMLDEANFEVGELTLICGENNTGKTYATYSLYGYLDYMHNNLKLDIGPKYFLWLSRIFEKYADSIQMQDDMVRLDIEIFKNLTIDFFQMLIEDYEHELADVLAGKIEDFENSNFRDILLQDFFAFLQNIGNARLKETLSHLFNKLVYFEFNDLDNTTILFNIRINNTKNIEIKIKRFCSEIINCIMTTIYPKPFILSAERTGATMFHKELAINKSEMIEKISRADDKHIRQMVLNMLHTRHSRYPKPVKDNIYFVHDLGEVSKQISFIKRCEKDSLLCAKIIEQLYKIVGGKYIASEQGIEFAPGARQRVTKGKFLIQRASSSVRSLLMLHYYILHIAEPNDILMIDEPELNLHPKNQILVARLLALLVNSGIKVFITTHSDYIVRELSNCIMLYNLSGDQIARLDKQEYGKEYGLEYTKIKAYLATNIRGKNTLKEVKITQDQGIFMQTFDEPIDSQNENQGLIFEAVLKANDINGGAKNDKCKSKEI